MRFSAGDIQRAVIENLTTETAVIAAPGEGRKILVLGLFVSPDAVTATGVEIESGTTDICGIFQLAADTPLVWPPTGLPYLECAANEALNITSDAAINGLVLYTIVDAASV